MNDSDFSDGSFSGGGIGESQDDFDFDDSYAPPPSNGANDGKTKLVDNDHHDEVHELSDDGSDIDPTVAAMQAAVPAERPASSRGHSRTTGQGEAAPATGGMGINPGGAGAAAAASMAGGGVGGGESESDQRYPVPGGQPADPYASPRSSDASDDYDQVVESRPSNNPGLTLNTAAAQEAAAEQSYGAVTTSPASSSDGEVDDEEEDNYEKLPPGAYNAEEFANMNVSDEIRELFQKIQRYRPHNVDLDTKLQPFIPDFIPAVGDIDPFIKIGRPDGRVDQLGLTVLDEPAAKQSDPVVMRLQLGDMTKKAVSQPTVVRSLSDVSNNPQKITNWINSIKDRHANKPAPTVHYTKTMPDIEQLMQVWPAEFEELLETTKLPTAELDVDTQTYVKIVCAMLDIPVHNNIIESLHVLFTLYSEFKQNQHFSANAGPTYGAVGAPY